MIAEVILRVGDTPVEITAPGVFLLVLIAVLAILVKNL